MRKPADQTKLEAANLHDSIEQLHASVAALKPAVASSVETYQLLKQIPGNADGTPLCTWGCGTARDSKTAAK